MAVSLREYWVPLLCALLLHMLALAALQVGWEPGARAPREIKPQIVHATLLVLERKAQPAPAKPVEQSAPALPAEEQARPPVEKNPPVVRDVRPDAADRAREIEAAAREERALREERARENRLRELADSSFLTALDSETSTLADRSTSASSSVVSKYCVMAIWTTSVQHNGSALTCVE